MRTLHLTLTLLVGLAAAAPAAEPQPGSLHKLHGWLCKRHPHNRWCVEHATSGTAQGEQADLARADLLSDSEKAAAAAAAAEEEKQEEEEVLGGVSMWNNMEQHGTIIYHIPMYSIWNDISRLHRSLHTQVPSRAA